MQQNETVRRIVARVERHLGDVVDSDTSDDAAAEECWTLCIDAANTMLRDPEAARKAAREACSELGYAATQESIRDRASALVATLLDA